MDNDIQIKTSRTLPNSFTIFCMILTTPNGFKEQKVQTVLSTWAWKCDNFKFITIKPSYLNNSKSKLEFNQNNILLKPEELESEHYRNLSSKVFLAFRDIYQKYANYDWYLKADDDTFIEMDNLRLFLSDKNPKEPVSFGQIFKPYVNYGYLSGGAGYLLSYESLKRLGSKLLQNSSYCPAGSHEDIFVARCLRLLGVYPNSTLDEFGKERFNSLNLKRLYIGMLPKWFNEYLVNPYRKVSDRLGFNLIILVLTINFL